MSEQRPWLSNCCNAEVKFIADFLCGIFKREPDDSHCECSKCHKRLKTNEAHQ